VGLGVLYVRKIIKQISNQSGKMNHQKSMQILDNGSKTWSEKLN
jgi:hypothetical protein